MIRRYNNSSTRSGNFMGRQRRPVRPQYSFPDSVTPTLAQAWDKHIPISRRAFFELMTADLPGEVEVWSYVDGPDFTIKVTLRQQGEVVLESEQVFHPYQKQVKHEEIKVDETCRGQGLGRTMSRNLTRAWQEAGADNLTLRAGRSHGGYVWARAGFLPEEYAWRKLRGTILERLEENADTIPANINKLLRSVLASDDPRGIWLIADQSHLIGDEKLGYRLLKQLEWAGKLDFGDHEQSTRLTAFHQPVHTPAKRPAPKTQPHTAP